MRKKWSMSDPGAVARFNSEPADALRARLRTCNNSPAWVERMLAGRPYRDPDELTSVARETVLTLGPTELDDALAGHPRIGERPTPAHADGAAFSRSEQSGVDGQDAVLAARLADGNARYERRFGHVFLIRAAGRDAAEVLVELERRLGNDPATERSETAGQLAEITALRVREVLAR